MPICAATANGRNISIIVIASSGRCRWAFRSGLFDTPAFAPDRTGLLVADRYDAEELRPAPWVPLNAARRKAETLRFARRAAGRVAGLLDPDAMALPEE